MKFIVPAQKEEQQDYQRHGCLKYVTLCALCSEDPRYCITE